MLFFVYKVETKIEYPQKNLHLNALMIIIRKMKTTYSNTEILQINHIHLAPQLWKFPVLTGSTSLWCETQMIYLQNLPAAFNSNEAAIH